MCRVTLGKAFLQFSAMKASSSFFFRTSSILLRRWGNHVVDETRYDSPNLIQQVAHAPPGHHSVIGKPSLGGLQFAEYVVYRGEQVRGHESTDLII